MCHLSFKIEEYSESIDVSVPQNDTITATHVPPFLNSENSRSIKEDETG